MATPRTGSLGIATTKGDLYGINANNDLDRLPVGNPDQVLVADPTASLGFAWQDPTFVSKASLDVDAIDAVFNKINIGGLIDLPSVKNRGTHSIIAYDDGTIQGIAWQRSVPLIYTAGTALLLKIYWVANTAVTGNVIWAAAFERDNAAGHDIDVDDFAALQTAAASTAPATAGIIQVASIAFTNAQADAIVAGDPFRLFIQRTANAAGDTMVGDAQLVRAVLEEV